MPTRWNWTSWTRLWAPKKRAYIVTAVDRATHTIVSWTVVPHRDLAALQPVVDHAPQAHTYYSDGLPGYQGLVYGLDGTHTAVLDKSETYSVEGGNADLRHYLARVVRRSRCFSRCMIA